MTDCFLDPNRKYGNTVLSNNNLTARLTGGATRASVIANMGKIKGRFYFEVYADSQSGENVLFTGVVGESYIGGNATTGDNTVRLYVGYSGNKQPEGVKYGATYATGDTISVLLNLEEYTLEFWKNGVTQGISHTNLNELNEKIYAVVGLTSSSNTHTATATINFGATPFIYEIPEGYQPYNAFPQSKILLLSEKDNETKRIEHSVFEVPNMTSISSPRGMVKSSSHRPILYHNYMAFDGNTNSRWEAGSRVDSWISYTFDENSVVNRYKIYSDGSTGMPKKFRFEVSENEQDWLTLDEQDLGLEDWSSSGWHTFEVKRTEFKSFRVFVESCNGGSYIRIPELQIEGNISKTVDIPSQSEQSFINHGMSHSELASTDFSSKFTEKHYIQNQSTPLGEGKVFRGKVNLKKHSDLRKLEVK